MNAKPYVRASNTFNIPSIDALAPHQLIAARTTFVLGRNGTGKSALVQWMYQKIPQPARFIPGSRTSHFRSESLDLTAARANQLRSNIRAGDVGVQARYRPSQSEQRNEAVIFEFQSQETQYKLDAAEEIKRDGSRSTAIMRLQQNSSPIDRLNVMMEQANIHVSFLLESGEMKAERDGSIFSLARMSDGERSALVITCEVLVAEPLTTFIIDEPELHMHPAIVVPLFKALIAGRPDCKFIVSTHELGIPVAIEDASVVLVRGCAWNGDAVQSWDADLLANTNEIPESLRVDLFGARRRLLFVEGGTDSLDQPFYALLFPEVSVVSKETCTEVIRAVNGLRASQETHHATAFGMIDGDGMEAAQASAFNCQHIYPVPFYSVESLYYCREVIEAVAERQAETLSTEATGLLTAACSRALATLDIESRNQLVLRICNRSLRDAVLRQLPKLDCIDDDVTREIQLNIPSPIATERRTDVIPENVLVYG